MNEVAPSNPELIKIPVSRLATYLKSSGWAQNSHPNNSLLVFQGPTDDFDTPLLLVLPSHENFGDWHKRLAEAINLLASVYKKSPTAILDEIIAQHLDTLRIRIGQENSTLPLEIASKIVADLSNFISFAAAAEENKRPYIDRRSDSSKRFSYECRFGQTFSGSFGFSIESPVIIEDRQLSIFENLSPSPFSRRVIQRIARGIETTKMAHDTQDALPLINNYETGFNGNMCDILADLILSWDADFYEFETLWATELRPPTSIVSIGSVKLERNCAQFLKLAARALRKEDEPELVTIAGEIVQLRLKNSEPEQTEEIDRERIVTIYGSSESGTHMTVKAFLEHDEYRLACDAHRDSYRVIIAGIMERKGTTRYIFSPTRFELIK